MPANHCGTKCAKATAGLVREPDNPHDANAMRVEWRGRKLGYLPRAENRAVAAAMDNGDKVDARIAKLRQHRESLASAC
jgi:hypothetical protein